MFECELILKIWLGQVPEYSIVFTRMVLCDALLGVFAPALWIAANATGNIKNNQVYGRLFALVILPVSYLLLLVYTDPILPFAVTILSSILYCGYCLYDIHKQIDLSIKNYARTVLKPTLLLTVTLVGIDFLIVSILNNDSIIRFFILFSLSVIVGCIMIYLLLEKDERIFINNQITKMFRK